jgi:glutamyl-tRNA synthetase
MADLNPITPRVRFAPSPTGYLHVGSARTFIFNWLFARHNHGTMVFRLDDTDTERNSEVSVQSIYEGLKWLGLDWDEEYKQSERLEMHRKAAWSIYEKGLAYRDFTPAHSGDDTQSGAQGAWLFNPGMRDLPREESDRRAAAGEPFALRYRVPRGEGRIVRFVDGVYGEQTKAADEIEDFALLRSDGNPTYHLASCFDDADLRITQIIRGQDHLTNTFKHVLTFEGLGAEAPAFAHLPLLVAPDGAKLSKRKHGPVVSVTTYRDAGFLPQAFINFLCLLGWSPKNDLEFMPLDQIRDLFTLENVNRANAVVNFSADVLAFNDAANTSENVAAIREITDWYTKEQAAKSPIAPKLAANKGSLFDAKAVWLNAQHLRALSMEAFARELQPFFDQVGYNAAPARTAAVAPLLQERVELLSEAIAAADFFFVEELAEYDPAELIPKKCDAALTRQVLQKALEVLPGVVFEHDPLEAAMRAAADALGVKAGPMFQPVRVAVCGRKNAPPLFETMTVLGKEVCLERIQQAIGKL